MKINKSALVIIALMFASMTFAQKIKIKKGIATVDKVALCKVEKDDVSRGAFYYNSLNDEELLYFKWVDWGEFGYFEAYKADDLDTVLFETEAGMGYRKYMLKKLYNAKVITSEGVNEEKLNQFAKKMGKEFTRKRNRY